MKALCFLPFLLGGHLAVSQTPADPQHMATFDSGAIATNESLSDEQKVTAIIERTLQSGRSTLPDGVTRITFVPPSNRDRDSIIAMGTHAVATLGNYVSDQNNFAQLIAARLLSDLGLPETYEPLIRALHPSRWQPVRVSALYGLAKLDRRLALPVLEQAKCDLDPKVRDTTKELLFEMQSSDADHGPNQAASCGRIDRN